MSAAALLGERPDPGAVASALLSAAMHVLLLLVLIFGVSWQNRPPEAVQVELWTPPPPPPVVEAPKPEPVPVKVEPAPPPKPEPVIPKPEIVEKAAPPKPKPAPKVEPKPVPPKPVAKVEQKPPPPKPVAKPEPLKPRVEDTRRMQDELMREQIALQMQRDQQMLKSNAAAAASEANAKVQAGWIDKVRAKIRGNIVLPPDIKGNPEAIFTVAQLPNGEVLSVRLKKSSGVAALDAAIERAVLKSSPLPRPDSGGFTPPREFELKYKPLD
jgi:colicin import membrane protein